VRVIPNAVQQSGVGLEFGKPHQSVFCVGSEDMPRLARARKAGVEPLNGICASFANWFIARIVDGER
jgi:hypothetical protein